jgi:hypothetical protein
VVGIITPTDLTRWLRRWQRSNSERAEPFICVAALT